MNPLVSVICVTRDRRHFIPQLVRQFERQTYPNLELVLVASGEPIADLLPADDRIRLYYYDSVISDSLNMAVNSAKGSVCVRFDDDDWQSPNRVAAQLAHLGACGKSVVGMMDLILYRVTQDYAYRVFCEKDRSPGAALAFRRDWALEHPFFGPRGYAEDTHFVREAFAAGEFSTVTMADLLVMQNHNANDSGRGMRADPSDAMVEISDNWFKVDVARIRHIVE